MRIVLDGMGSDNAPTPEVEAAVAVAAEFQRAGDELVVVGQEHLLHAALHNHNGRHGPIQVLHASQIISMTDRPATSAREKSDNSMAVGLDLLKAGHAQAFVTAGNTGAAMASALFRLGRLPGVRRPALAAVFPVRGGRTIVLDIGANADCKPEHLVQFAVLGSLYAECVLDLPCPRIGLLSNGEETVKGNALVQEAFPLLQSAGLNFIGNVEGKELFAHAADVVVTDGFTGNVLLKSSEAVAKLVGELLVEQLRASPRTALGGLLARPALLRLKRRLDPAEVGAAALLGVNGWAFIGHGRSDGRALANALRLARRAVQSGVLERMHAQIRAQLTLAQGAA